MAILVQQNEATAALRRMYFHCVDATDGMTPETGEAGGQPQISKNGGAWANTGATLTAIGNGRYYVELAIGEIDTLGIVEGRYKSANTAEAIGTTLQVVPFNPYDPIRMGLTALPNANADAAGGLPISDAGGLDLDSKLANTNEVTAARMGALTDWINGGRLDLILDIIAADVANIDGAAMRGTDGANTTVPDAAGTAASLHATTNGLITVVDTVVDEIKAKTDNLNFTSTNVHAHVKVEDNIDFGATKKASIETAVQNKIEANDLDNISKISAGATKPTDGSYLDQIMNKDGNQTFDSTTDSLEALQASTGITQQQVRDAMKLAPTAGAPATGSIDKDLDLIKDGGADDFEPTTDSLHDLRAKVDTISGGTPVNIQHDSTTIVRD